MVKTAAQKHKTSPGVASQTPPASAAPASKGRDHTLEACIVAAFVWLTVALYLCLVVPQEFSKTEILPADLPFLSRAVVYIFEGYGTTISALIGLLGCCYAHARRNTRLANGLIVAGACCILFLIAELLTHPEKAPVKPLKMPTLTGKP